MTDVFISYSHKDRDYAHRLADEFRRHNIDVWIDDRIDYGDEWPRTIQQNLSACRTFIVIMSTNSFNSMWVQNEVSYAQAAHKTIFPLLLEGEVWLSMAAMQYVDVRAGGMPPSRFYVKVLNSLNSPAPSGIERRISEIPVMQPTTDHITSPRKSRTALFLAGSLLVLAVMAGFLYSVLGPGNGATPAAPTQVTLGPTQAATEPGGSGGPPTDWTAVTEELPTEASVTEPSQEGPASTEASIGSVLSAEGKLTLLRVHDVGTGYGPPSDFLDAEVVIQLDNEPNKAYGFQLRNNLNENINWEMLELLRDAFNRDGRVSIDYLRTGENNGVIIRVMSLP